MWHRLRFCSYSERCRLFRVSFWITFWNTCVFGPRIRYIQTFPIKRSYEILEVPANIGTNYLYIHFSSCYSICRWPLAECSNSPPFMDCFSIVFAVVSCWKKLNSATDYILKWNSWRSLRKGSYWVFYGNKFRYCWNSEYWAFFTLGGSVEYYRVTATPVNIGDSVQLFSLCQGCVNTLKPR